METILDIHLRSHCLLCGQEHSLGVGNTLTHCRALMRRLENERQIDFLETSSFSPDCSTATLFAEPRGKMFGVLEGIDKWGKMAVLYAFSGQFNGLWSVPGWAPPLFDEEAWWKTNNQSERIIKSLTREMAMEPEDSRRYQNLKNRRKRLSRLLMAELHALYRISNFNGHQLSLDKIFTNGKGIPTGTGDCCAPKLLNFAQLLGVIPTGIAEFYWGKENRSATREHGSFYPACEDKCMPLLGFMLCGAEELRQRTGG